MPDAQKEPAFTLLVREIRALPICPDAVAAVMRVLEGFAGRPVYIRKEQQDRRGMIRREALRLARGRTALEVAELLRDGFRITDRQARIYAGAAVRALRPKCKPPKDGPGASLCGR